MYKYFLLLTMLLSCGLISISHAESKNDFWEQSKKQAEKIENECGEKAFKNVGMSVADSLNASGKKIECINKHIYKEINKGFEKEDRTEVKKKIDEIIKLYSSFYGDYFYINKYCKGHCGTIGNQLADGEIVYQQSKILQELIYLNLNGLPY